MRSDRIIHHLLLMHTSRNSLFSSTSCTSRRLLSFLTHTTTEIKLPTKTLQFHNPRHHFHFHFRLLGLSLNQQPSSAIYYYYYPSFASRFFNTSSTQSDDQEKGNTEGYQLQYETSKEEEADGWDFGEETDGWEEEEEVESKAGDGGDGGGVVLQGVPWGERALSIAREVLPQFGDDMALYAFKTTPRGYVYMRLDKLSNEYGCPSLEELESYCQEYKKRLEEVGALGEIPDDLALEVSSPGAERILKVPDDLSRFIDKPMRVCYIEGNGPEKNGVFFLESIETESENCVWKLADVKENRDPESKGRPLSRKRRDWRLKLPFEMHRRVTLYLEL